VIANNNYNLIMNPQNTLRYTNLSLYALIEKDKKKRPKSQDSSRKKNLDIKGK